MLATALPLGSALITSETVAGQMSETATAEATRIAETVVRSYVDPLITTDVIEHPDSVAGEEIDRQLERVVGSGSIVRIKIWSPTGQVLFSDLPALRGRQFEVDDDLGDAMRGEASHGLSDGSGGENVFERGLAKRFLEIYLPIKRPGTSTALAAYEIYEDATPLEERIQTTRQDVFLIATAMALGLLLLFFAAFSGTARRLARQNDRLRSLTATLRRSEARFRSLVQNSSDVFVVVEASGAVKYESVAVERILGYPPDQRTRRNILELVHPDDRGRAGNVLAELSISPASERTIEISMAHADGSWRTVDWTAKNLLHDPDVEGLVINYRDVTERKALEEQLTHQAFHDPLTGLANRALFADRVEHALARRRRHRQALAIVFFDLDDFKRVNDTLGHAAGDELLVEVGRRLMDVTRPGDTVARLSGDEFAALLEEVGSVEDAVDAAQRIGDRLREPIVIHGREITVTASMGIAPSLMDGQTPEDLLAQADVAMYEAKERGKARCDVFDPTMRTRAWSRLELEAELRRGIERGELTVFYQPVVDLTTGRMTDVEALVRWQHPERGLLEPGRFISLAEETGLIVPLGEFVMREACRQTRAWQLQFPSEPHLAVNVNLSAHQFQDKHLAAGVAAILAASGLHPSSLKLEITETAMMADTEATDATMRELHALGIRLVVDDFGTGFSGLNYFRRFGLDELKIDRSFVAGLGRDPQTTAIVNATIAFARALSLTVTAEGIENEEQLGRLRLLGCEKGQGYYFARPLSAETLTGLLVEMPLAPAA